MARGVACSNRDRRIGGQYRRRRPAHPWSRCGFKEGAPTAASERQSQAEEAAADDGTHDADLADSRAKLVQTSTDRGERPQWMSFGDKSSSSSPKISATPPWRHRGRLPAESATNYASDFVRSL